MPVPMQKWRFLKDLTLLESTIISTPSYDTYLDPEFMADYVFSLGLIPVQDWIAQARRSRDLRAGSVFLWHTLAKLLARLEGESTQLGTVEIWTPEPPPRGFDGLAGLSFQEALSLRHRLCCAN